MRSRTWITLVFIILLAIFATWVALPGSNYDIKGFRAAHPVREGLDLQGGLQVVLQANPVAGQTLDAETLEGTRQTLERRINALGVSEPLIQTRGSDQIIVELPGIRNPEDAIQIMQQTALLEIIDPQGRSLPPGTIVDTTLGAADRGSGAAATPVGSPVAGSATPVAGAMATPVAESSTPTGPVYQTIISGADLKDAYATTGNTGIGQVVAFELQSDAAGRFFEYTSSHLGQPMSIVIDKQVISSPVINGAISSSGIIEGIPPAEVQNMVIQLKAGALSVPLEVVQSQTVSPSLGQDSLQRSLIAGSVGLFIVALFMILYYRLPGLVSVVALIFYAVLTVAIFKLIPVTLTLAGIAGFILSIGMAVDANVLIFERIREELRAGRSTMNAVDAGYTEASRAIWDANVTNVIAAVLMIWFGSGPVKGFAVVLTIGIITSVFTGVVVCRMFNVLWLKRARPAKLVL